MTVKGSIMDITSMMTEGRMVGVMEIKYGIDWDRGRSALTRDREEGGSRKIEENTITSRSTWNMPL